MKLRKNIFPNNSADWSSFVFIFLIIPLFYWFELTVIQDFYSIFSSWFWLHFILGTFIMMNIVSNLLAVTFIDTSIFSVQSSFEQNYNWKYCSLCHLKVPPRCWHCDICKKCILKRDHHCTFAGCCIGHYNHRYFMIFLLYFFIGCCYALYLNLFYIIPRIDLDYTIIFQIITPIMLVLFDQKNIMKYILIILLVLNIVGLIISGALLRFHLRLVFKGSVSYEYNKDITLYNQGLKYNIICIFGSRWYLTWISPFIESTLLFDGVDWRIENIVIKTKKI